MQRRPSSLNYFTNLFRIRVSSLNYFKAVVIKNFNVGKWEKISRAEVSVNMHDIFIDVACQRSLLVKSWKPVNCGFK